MAKIISITPYLKSQKAARTATYAIITIPAVVNTQVPKKRHSLCAISQAVDVLVSLLLGAVLLLFLVLLVISL